MNVKSKTVAMMAKASMVLVLLAAIAWSQAPAAPTPEVLKRTLSLEGKWTGQAALHEGGKTINYPMHLVFRKTPDQNHITFTAEADLPEVGKVHEFGLAGFETAANKLRWYAMNSPGEAWVGTGELMDPNHLRLVFEDQRYGKPLRTEANFFWKNDKTIELKENSTLGGALQYEMEATFVRKWSLF
jgi:hypothetical protein